VTLKRNLSNIYGGRIITPNRLAQLRVRITPVTKDALSQRSVVASDWLGLEGSLACGKRFH